MRVQNGSPILHGEMSALENAGRLPASVYKKCTMYTTLSPCQMCSGTIVFYGIKRVVIGENENFIGAESFVKAHNVELINLNDEKCKKIMKSFIDKKPEIWNEDIAE
ncbi:cytosine deaminase [Ascoidea rubescens DSM 1968]|uniref:Cytidine deaminase-like protein n=1 Tax=Ascoidea rubescens DSM 1968 TaxID=1344418 RepID=A0A1D2VRJ4_9ASCO|nr:cytidine deaminase-like protein [Ascoidea rubescens DSM 1968]ODV64198.1 cytidine deaminase-like protein [Ascoidea rubescens DSM 1968]